jgi:leucyl-tRNA synthetase
MNEKLGFKPLYESKWPEYDEAKTVENEITIAVQVNGKLRATLKVNKDISKDDLLKEAKNEENVSKYLVDKEIIKEIVIPGRIVNLVIK